MAGSVTPTLQTASMNALVDLIDRQWVKTYESVPQTARKSGIWSEMPWMQEWGESKRFTEIEIQEYADDKPEGAKAQEASVQIGYSKDATLVRRGNNLGVTWELRNRNKYPEVLRKVEGMAKMVLNRMDLDLAHRLTFAEDTSYTDKDGNTVDLTTGDGLALASTAHTLLASSTTFRNILSGNPRLSQGSLEAMEELARANTYNHFGEKMSCMLDILWYADDPETENMAKQLMQATADISAPNEGVPNVYQAKYRTVRIDRLATDANGGNDRDKAKRWGLASSAYDNLRFYVEQDAVLIKPRVNGKELSYDNVEDVETDSVTYRTRGSYSIVSISPRGFFISLGDGS